MREKPIHLKVEPDVLIGFFTACWQTSPMGTSGPTLNRSVCPHEAGRSAFHLGPVRHVRLKDRRVTVSPTFKEKSDKSLAKGGACLCFRPLPMQKTKKSVAKRFKLTATGKLVRRTPGFRHLLGAKSSKQKRRASRDKLVAEGHAKPLKRALPFGL